MKHIMLDLETLGTGNRAAIVAIGACGFDPHGDDVPDSDWFQVCITPASAIAAGGEVDGGTVSWWMQQSDAARQQTFPVDAVEIALALKWFTHFVEYRGKDVAVWGNGATFDNIVIRSAYKALGLQVPWSFRGDKCYRTVINLLPEDRRPPFERHGVAHHAVDDAVTQARYLQKIYKALGL